MSLINAMSQNDTTTLNGAITNSTSLSNSLDLFFIAGASRGMSDSDIERMINKSFNQDELLTLKLIFWAGDILEGAGERRFFRIGINWLFNNYKTVFDKVFKLIPHYNRWDSLFYNDNQVMQFIKEKINSKDDNLLFKWLPREGKNKYKSFQKELKKFLGLSDKQYRKMLVENSKTVENLICKNKWDDIEFSKVPSVAFNMYKNAFKKHSPIKFDNFITKVEKGEEKINTNVLFPHNLYQSYRNGGDKNVINLQWKSLPNTLENVNRRFLPVCDTSGSMYDNNELPIAISIALGIYLSERNNSIFKDCFITFSSRPVLQKLSGNFTDRVGQMKQIVDNTNIQAVFDLILSSAIRENVSENDMPTDILIISDMEFDQAYCGRFDINNFDLIDMKYKESGYKRPNLIFWNANSREGNVPVNRWSSKVSLISGASPNVIKNILDGEILNPEQTMLKVLNGDRYNLITI